RTRHGVATCEWRSPRPVCVDTAADRDTGLPSHLATICWFDPATGACRGLSTGRTYMRSGRRASAQLVAREDAPVLTILGAGVQGEHHLNPFPLVRDFEEIRIGSLYLEDAERLASSHPRARAGEDIERPVRNCDVVALS